MASFGRLVATPASATIDATIALANLNFDFSLCKVEAQEEFRGVGSSLSPTRRYDAESGPTHVTARKLGALFEPLLPSTPALAKAYGLRATEIIEKSKLEKEVQPSLGVFASQVGVDGTSIWAAATSGHGTIRVHLLACMLARIWEASEATSIWVEIVQERKKDIASMFNSGSAADISTYMTAQQELTREQLANWDASARAWLRVADGVEARRQKQLELILSNVNVSVNSKPTVWESVLQAWKSAMQAVDSLICGMPQQAQTGELFLGLSAWHLFPDILVLGISTTPVKLKDPLVHPAGVLTLGLQSDQTGQEDGVHWSLPLAHLRYYGDPVVTSRSVTKNGSRLTLAEFLQATLGAVFESWGDQGKNAEGCAQYLKALKAGTQFGPSRPNQMPEDTWLDILSTAAADFLACDPQQRNRYCQLHVLGRKCSRNLLGETSHPGFAFGNTSTWLALHSGREEFIKALRVIASKLPVEADNLFIRYRTSNWECCSSTYEYCTAKLASSGQPQLQKHCRWVHTGSDPSHLNKSDGTIKSMKARIQAQTETYNMTGELVKPLEGQLLCEEDGGERILWRKQNRERGELEERVFQSMTGKTQQRLKKQQQFLTEKHFYKLLIGDLETAAIYIVCDCECKSTPIRDRYKAEAAAQRKSAIARIVEGVSLSDITGAITDKTNISVVRGQYEQAFQCLEKDYLHSLRAIASIVKIYKALPHATIDVRILQQPLRQQIWVPGVLVEKPTDLLERLSPLPLNRGACFSCIIKLESSQYNIDPDKLNNVLAISSADSIFVASPLLCDPADVWGEDKIQRIMGNVGRAGIALLVPPQSPKVKKLGLDTWDLVNHFPFDGKFEDCFANTSLHLSFTGASMPVDIGFTGSCDKEIYILETLVSVHEGGQWVADLDVLGSLARSELERDLSRKPGCNNEHRKARHCDLPITLKSLENWTEFLDRPNYSIFKAQDNWQARLAATVLGLAQGYRVLVLRPDVCWKCVKDHIDRHSRCRAKLTALSGSAVGKNVATQMELFTFIA